LVSFRTIRRPLIPKPFSWLGLFCLFLQQDSSNPISKYSYLSSQQNRAGSSGSATYFSSSLTTKSWISFIRFNCFNSALSGVGDRSLFRFSFEAIHILRKHFFFNNHNIFTDFFGNCFLLYVLKISNYSMKISSKCNVEKEILYLTKKPIFCKKLGNQIKFCALKVLT
jgi:hypothetical protein